MSTTTPEQMIESSSERAPQEPCDHISAPLPPFDRAHGTKKWCIVGLVFCYILSFALIGTGSAFWALRGYQTGFCDGKLILLNDSERWPYYAVPGLTSHSSEVVLLALNLLVTLATECVGYIHATSLRWALFYEDKLRHNSNLRLFTSAKRSMPNRWFVNALWILSITVSYSCASQLVLVPSDSGGGDDVVVSSLSMITLGCCILILSLLATWTLVPTYSSHIATWNSDPLNTALATQHIRRQRIEAPISPNSSLQHCAMINTSRSIRYMLIFLWLLVPLLLIAGFTTWNLTDRQDTTFISEGYPSSSAHWPLFLVDTKSGPCNGVESRIVVINILFVAGLQLLYTIALHVAEQFANLDRDERAWRHASRLDPKTGGALIGRDAMKAAATAWPTVFLLTMKPMCHWLFGLSFPVGQKQMILYHPYPLFALAAAVFLLASFATYLALKRPKGPQPSAYGNIEKLVNMIDDWGKGAGTRICWGEKDKSNNGTGARCVGTSANVEDLVEVKIEDVAGPGHLNRFH